MGADERLALSDDARKSSHADIATAHDLLRRLSVASSFPHHHPVLLLRPLCPLHQSSVATRPTLLPRSLVVAEGHYLLQTLGCRKIRPS